VYRQTIRMGLGHEECSAYIRSSPWKEAPCKKSRKETFVRGSVSSKWAGGSGTHAWRSDGVDVGRSLKLSFMKNIKGGGIPSASSWNFFSVHLSKVDKECVQLL